MKNKMNNGESKPWTIAFEEKGEFYKITKIIFYKDGGFGVMVPYHSANNGYLFKADLDYRKRVRWYPREEVVEYSASDKVKLSIHYDGFVQFSGINPQKITSGRDSDKAKGLGIFTKPLSYPIRSGPTFAIVSWGLPEFEVLEAREVKKDHTIIFWEEDYYFRRCTDKDWNGYLLEAFVVERNEGPNLRPVHNHNRNELQYVRPFYPYEIPGTIFCLKCIPPGHRTYFIAFIAFKIKTKFSSSSGFALCSPSRVTKVDGHGRIVKATALFAVYPSPVKDQPLQTLDYLPSPAENRP